MVPAFTVGRWRVHRIEEWQGVFAPPEALFTGFEPEVFAREAAALTPDYVREGWVYGYLQTWLLEDGRERILFDTGAGNGKSRPGLAAFGDMDTAFLDHLSAAGFEPSSIDTVVCSHLHIDHVGWNTVAHDGAWVPTFPNARYVMPRSEREIWDPAGQIFATLHGAAVNEGVFEDSVQPILDAGREVLVEDGFEVAPGLVLRNAPGHTPGQMLLDATVGGERALFVADVLHHPMEMIRPHWNSVYCEDAEQARATRREVLSDAAETGARLVPAHLGGAHSVFVVRDGDGFRPRPGPEG